MGGLHIPSIPNFPGAENFKGPRFHSARWLKGFDPTGKRIGVIGTGASAVQIVPNIADKVSCLTKRHNNPLRHPVKIFNFCGRHIV